MEHPYEYAVMINFLQAVSISGVPDFANPKVQESLTIAFNKFAGDELPKAIAKLPPADWQINSHSVTLAGDVLMISILLQRHRT